MINWFTTNKQLRKELKFAHDRYKERGELLSDFVRKTQKLEEEKRNLVRQIEFLTPKKAVTKAPSRSVERPIKGTAYLPTRPVVYLPPAETSVRKEDESNSVNSFLAGAAIGYVVNEVFSNDSSSSNSSSSAPDSSSFDSGGGGSFGGGGASSDW